MGAPKQFIRQAIGSWSGYTGLRSLGLAGNAKKILFGRLWTAWLRILAGLGALAEAGRFWLSGWLSLAREIISFGGY